MFYIVDFIESHYVNLPDYWIEMEIGDRKMMTAAASICAMIIAGIPMTK